MKDENVKMYVDFLHNAAIAVLPEVAKAFIEAGFNTDEATTKKIAKHAYDIAFAMVAHRQRIDKYTMESIDKMTRDQQEGGSCQS